MQNHIDIHVHSYDGFLLIQGNSLTHDGCCVYEAPERLAITASDGDLGRAVIVAAERCRGEVNEPATMAEANAQTLGFKSWNEQQKKAIHICITRRKGEADFHILPVRKANKSGTSYVFTTTMLTAPINDAEAIGQAAREALRLSAEWKELPPLKF